MNKNLMLVGVGGQGIILASKILSYGLIEEGYDVKMSEIHGMAQRGGSVTTQVKFGDKVYSPCIGEGEADVLIAFEKLEAARWLPFLKEDGKLVINDCEIHPMTVQTGAESYPENLIEKIKVKNSAVNIIDALACAEELGNPKVQNIVLLGSLIKALELTNIDWEKVLRANIPEKFIDINLKALKKGME